MAADETGRLAVVDARMAAQTTLDEWEKTLANAEAAAEKARAIYVKLEREQNDTAIVVNRLRQAVNEVHEEIVEKVEPDYERSRR
jgi:hypothetical protein